MYFQKPINDLCQTKIYRPVVHVDTSAFYPKPVDTVVSMISFFIDKPINN